MQSEPQLFQYGILTENSDVRAHVSVVNKAIYVFRTIHGIRAVETKSRDELKFAYQPGVVGATAKGWAVAVDEIEDMRRVDMSSMSWPSEQFGMSTSDKGDFAVSVVIRALSQGIFPLWLDFQSESSDAKIQIAGTDVVLAFNQRIQVKCDWKSGEKPRGTGNVFLQFSERNPKKMR